jgi:hypothetical protein
MLALMYNFTGKWLFFGFTNLNACLGYALAGAIEVFIK